MLGRTDSGRRLLLLLIVFVVAAGALVTRLGYWQVAQRDQLVESARRQIYFREEVPSRRGQIYDPAVFRRFIPTPRANRSDQFGCGEITVWRGEVNG